MAVLLTLVFLSMAQLTILSEIVDAYPWIFARSSIISWIERIRLVQKGLNMQLQKVWALLSWDLCAEASSQVLCLLKYRISGTRHQLRRTPAEWGLRWVWNHPEVTVVLSGMNEEAHIEENLRIADEAYPNSLNKTNCNLWIEWSKNTENS